MNARISTWDWHYRVGFDVELSREISEVVEGLRSEKLKRQISTHLELFSDYVSMDAIFQAIRERPEDAERYISEASNKRLLYCPKFASKHWPAKRSELPELAESSFKELSQMVQESRRSRFSNLNRDYFEVTFTAGGFQRLLSDGLNHQEVEGGIISPFKKSKSEVTHQVGRLKWHLTNMEEAARYLYPKMIDLPSVDYSFEVSNEIECWAEYWPTQLTGKRNKLKVGTELIKSGDELISSTLVHEIVGHAFFYELFEKKDLDLIDQGAHCLIEGWATWCEWNCIYLDSELRRRLKSDACRQLDYALEDDHEKITSEILRYCSLKGYSEVVAANSVLSFFQYPCLSHSYVFGALGIAGILMEKSLEEFWEDLEEMGQVGNYLNI